jgi:hypothetical protein
MIKVPNTTYPSADIHRHQYSSLGGSEGFQAKVYPRPVASLDSGFPQEALIHKTSGHWTCISIPCLILISISGSRICWRTPISSETAHRTPNNSLSI